MKATRTMPEADASRQPPLALDEAFARMQDELLGTLYHLVGNRHDAEDALQEAFVKCWNQRHKLDGIENLRAWIFRIVLNTGRDLRRSGWNRRREPWTGDDDVAPTATDNPATRMEEEEQVAQVRAAVRDLRPEEQEVFLLRQNGELTYEQIAELVGIPPGTAKTRMRLALEKLRVALEAI